MGLSVATRVELGKATVGVTADVPITPTTSTTGSVAVGAVVTVPAPTPAPVVTVPPAPVLTAPVEPALEVVSAIVDPFEEMLMAWPKPVVGNLPELCGQPAAAEKPAAAQGPAEESPAVPRA